MQTPLRLLPFYAELKGHSHHSSLWTVEGQWFLPDVALEEDFHGSTSFRGVCLYYHR